MPNKQDNNNLPALPLQIKKLKNIFLIKEIKKLA